MTQRMREYRFDPLQRRWSIIATGRDERPLEHRLATPPSPTDVACEFCPGREEHTPAAVHTVTSGTGAWRLRVVPNKYPAGSSGGAFLFL